MTEHVVVSSRGVTVQVNEDWYETNKREGLYIVSDGLSDRASGEIAARLAATTIEDFVVRTRAGSIKDLPFRYDPELGREANRLKMSMRVANAALREHAARESEHAGMGATAVATLLTDGAACIALVGDCRAYRYSEGTLRPLSGAPPADQALGLEDDVEVTMINRDLEDGDLLLLCTDGLPQAASERRIAEILAAGVDVTDGEYQLEAVADELARQPTRRNLPADATVLLIRYE